MTNNPIDEWTHGTQRVQYAEIALRHDQAELAACFLHRSATCLMAVAIKDAIPAAVPEPWNSSDPDIAGAYQIAGRFETLLRIHRLLRRG